MEDYFLDEAEELAVDTIKSYFYSSDFSMDSVKSVLSPIASARRSMVLEAAFVQVSAEQAQRRRYIAATLSPGEEKEMERGKAEILAEDLYADSSSGEQASLFSKVGIDIGINKVGDEVIEQAKIYQATNKNIEFFASALLVTQKINPIFSPLNNLDTNSLQELTNSMSEYISLVIEGRKEDRAYDPPFSNTTIALLTRARLHLLIENMDNINRKLDFLTSIITVSQGIVINRSENTSNISEENSLKMAMGKLMHMYNTSFEYVI